VLVQALAKGGRDELAVETATELGVDEVVPWQAARSVVQWRGERGTKARAGWESIARAAAKQSRRARVPAIAALASSADVQARMGGAALAVVLHEDADAALAGMLLPSAGDVVLVVGPEGGITPDELELFGGAGAMVCRLGPHVLRSSTAGPAAIAVLSAAVRWR
jgi:16S rRNA (uracil1498-N3)-methyltransferase